MIKTSGKFCERVKNWGITAPLPRIFLIGCVLFLPSSAPCAFREIGWGARPEAMGGAFTAVANDANAFAYNPAGTVLTGKSEITFSYIKPYVGFGSDVDLSMFYTAFARSINHHLGFGLGWNNFSSPNLKENVLLFNFAMNLGVIAKSIGRDFILGGNIKRMSRSFKLDQRAIGDPVFVSGDGSTVYGFDFGIWTAPFSREEFPFSLGLALKNVNQPDAGLKTEDQVPMEISYGFAYGAGRPLLTFDYSRRNGLSTYRGGTEIWFFEKKLAIRAGGNSSNGSLGFGYRHSFGKYFLILDYAFIMPFYIQETAGTHRFSLALHL